MKTICTTLLIAAIFIFCSRAHAAPQQQEHVDLARGMEFERFMMTERAFYAEKMMRRIKQLTLNENLTAAALRVEKLLTLVVYGSMTCPDCLVVVPYLEKTAELNRNIQLLYFEREQEDRELLVRHTGVDRIPSIIVSDESGFLTAGFFAEFPKSVRALVDASADRDEVLSHVNDFRAFKYDDEVQDDLAVLIGSGYMEIYRD